MDRRRSGVTFSRKGFMYIAKEPWKRFFALCQKGSANSSRALVFFSFFLSCFQVSRK